jgi:hypothetical protein
VVRPEENSNAGSSDVFVSTIEARAISSGTEPDFTVFAMKVFTIPVALSVRQRVEGRRSDETVINLGS